MLRFLYSLYRIYMYVARPLTLGVRVMLVRREEVLLVRQTYIDGWYLPGGGIHKGETLEQAARREVKEEVGAHLASISLMGVYSNFSEWRSDHNALFISDDFTLSGDHDSEIAEMRFFPLDALPSDLWTGHRQRILEYHRAVQAHETFQIPRFGEW